MHILAVNPFKINLWGLEIELNSAAKIILLCHKERGIKIWNHLTVIVFGIQTISSHV